MRVQRTRHTRAYVQIPNEIAQSSMSLAELGLLVRLLSLPDKSRATVETITARGCGPARISTGALGLHTLSIGATPASGS